MAAVLLLFLSATPANAQLRKINIAYTATSPYQAVLIVAKEVGLDMARLEKDMASEEARATIEESLKLAESLGLNGTPSYVIGPNVVIGAVGVDALREKVNTARCGKAAC